jgi:hypothetical protein
MLGLVRCATASLLIPHNPYEKNIRFPEESHHIKRCLFSFVNGYTLFHNSTSSTKKAILAAQARTILP